MNNKNVLLNKNKQPRNDKICRNAERKSVFEGLFKQHASSNKCQELSQDSTGGLVTGEVWSWLRWDTTPTPHRFSSVYQTSHTIPSELLQEVKTQTPDFNTMFFMCSHP